MNNPDENFHDIPQAAEEYIRSLNYKEKIWKIKIFQFGF